MAMDSPEVMATLDTATAPAGKSGLDALPEVWIGQGVLVGS